MVSTFKRNIILGLGISLTTLIISSVASYISIQKLVESDYWVDHTFKVIQDLDYVLSRIKDAETGQRGYLLSGDPVFLEPYNGSKQDILDHIDHVQLLTADNNSQQKEFPVLQGLIRDKYAFIDGTIADRKIGRPVTTARLLYGKGIMDKIRQKIRLMEQREQKLMLSRTARVSAFATYTPILIVFASILAIIITYAFYRRMRSNLDDTQRLQDELEKKEQDTEKHIKVISELAEQISKGNYDIRVKDSDLK
jgi:CHASE3 domain sensor protein